MSKKRTMQIDVIEEVKGTQFMQCKLYIAVSYTHLTLPTT